MVNRVGFMDSHAGEGLLCHIGSFRASDAVARKQGSALHSAEEKLQPAMDVRSSLVTTAGTPVSAGALLRNIGVSAGG